ncbi:MAG: branched-chain amino acid ABC transporter permease [Bacillota bacterium]
MSRYLPKFGKQDRPGLYRLVFSAAVILLLMILPFSVSKYTVVLLSTIMMYVVITVSWTLFSGSTRYISLASAAFFGIGVYTAAVFGRALPLPVVIAIGGLLSFCLALIIGALTLRLRGIYFAMFTLGIVEFIVTFLRWWEAKFSGTVGRVVVSVDYTIVYYVMLAIFLVLMLTVHFLERSKFGLALKGIGECEEAAAHAGVNTTRLKVVTFAVSAFFIGATGVIMATRWTYIDPKIAFNLQYSFLPVVMAIIGGMGQLYGPIIGAVFFTYLEEFLITRLPYHYMLIFGVIMVAAILYLPEGLTGLVQKWWKRGSEGKNAHFGG